MSPAPVAKHMHGDAGKHEVEQAAEANSIGDSA